MLGGLISLLISGFTLFAALPSTSTYQLNSYGFGSGGTANTKTSTYSLEGISGEVSGQSASTSNYVLKPGFIETQQAYVPKVTLTNPSNYYDKLKFVIDTQSNPTDAKYALQISTTSDFSSSINYIKSDLTIGASLTISDYQTYTTWGGASGSNIIGLSPSTTYYLRAKSIQHLTTQNDGKYTETAYGPSSSAATVSPSLSLCIYTGANCAAGGNSEAFGNLTAGSVTNSPSNIGIDFATNADAGGKVYIYSLNGGLNSSTNGHTISSATVDLSSGGTLEGYGAQITSVSQTSGGPLSKASPYNSSGNNVGALSTTISQLLSSTAPIVGGTAAVQLQAKSGITTQAGTDYADTLTIIAAAAF